VSAQAPHLIKQHLSHIFDELIGHDGYGEFKVELRILKRGQKEVLIHYGKQYRYVVDLASPDKPHGAAEALNF
jgi:hypothetical protein